MSRGVFQRSWKDCKTVDILIGRSKMQKQTMTIRMGGKGGTITAESLVDVVESLVEMLKSVDRNMWKVDNPRYRWKITQASKTNPLTLTLEAESAIPDAPEADVVGGVVDGLKRLEKDARTMPKHFSPDDLKQAKRLVHVYNDLMDTLEIETERAGTYRPTKRIIDSVDRIQVKAKAIKPTKQYGSLEGVLRRVTIDERDERSESDLQLIDRETGELVQCVLEPDVAADLATHFRQRVVLFGEITRDAFHRPIRVSVETFKAIKGEKVPTLADLHRIGLDITGGEDAADYVRRLRDTSE